MCFLFFLSFFSSHFHCWIMRKSIFSDENGAQTVLSRVVKVESGWVGVQQTIFFRDGLILAESSKLQWVLDWRAVCILLSCLWHCQYDSRLNVSHIMRKPAFGIVGPDRTHSQSLPTGLQILLINKNSRKGFFNHIQNLVLCSPNKAINVSVVTN